jgi:REP element-mobilizing transposase RayT
MFIGDNSNGEMRLSRYGETVQFNWGNLPKRYPNIELDAFIVMPNHVHGIIILIDELERASLENLSAEMQGFLVKPTPPQTAKIAATQSSIAVRAKSHGLPEIIRGFKTFSARRINQIRGTAGLPVWQRDYYEHIIRNEESLHKIREYIINNPLSWQQDQLHPHNPSKW